MPKLNYGFKGDALTAAQAIEAGATITSQDYKYFAQLGAITPLLPPGVPTSLSATAGDQQVALTWTAPSSSSSITGYSIEITPAGGSPYTASAGGTSTTITGLTNGVEYSFRVSASTNGGTGDYGSAATATPTAVTYACTYTDAYIFKNQPVRNPPSSTDPTTITRSESMAKGPVSLTTSGFAKSAFNGTINLSFNNATYGNGTYYTGRGIAWTGTLNGYTVSLSLTTAYGTSYYDGMEYSTAPSYYGLASPVGAKTSAWKLQIYTPAPPYPQDPDWNDEAAVSAFYAAMDAYYQWSYSPHDEAVAYMPVVFDYRSTPNDVVVSNDQRMLYQASVRTSTINNYDIDGPVISDQNGAYSEPNLCSATSSEWPCKFGWAIRETVVNSGNATYYWDQSADISGTVSANSGNGYYQSNGIWVIASVQSASRYFRLTMPNTTCYP